MPAIKPGALNERDDHDETGDIGARVEGVQVRPGVPAKTDVNHDGVPPVDPDKMPDIAAPSSDELLRRIPAVAGVHAARAEIAAQDNKHDKKDAAARREPPKPGGSKKNR